MLSRFISKRFFLGFNPAQSFATKKSGKGKAIDEGQFNILQALRLTKAYAVSAFEETVEVHVKLNVDPKHGDQVVRGSCMMPYGLGKSSIVAVYTTEENREKAKAAGADVIVDAQTLEEIKNGVIKFEKLVATAEVVASLKPFARILGPKGMMPNAKVGTLVPAEKLEQTVKETKMGSVTYRVDPGSTIHAPLGKVGFSDERILGNLKSLINSLHERRPAAVKGTYLLEAHLSSTMGPGWKVNVETLDPKAKTCLL